MRSGEVMSCVFSLFMRHLIGLDSVPQWSLIEVDGHHHSSLLQNLSIYITSESVILLVAR
jgi:hypothetical protein